MTRSGPSTFSSPAPFKLHLNRQEFMNDPHSRPAGRKAAGRRRTHAASFGCAAGLCATLLVGPALALDDHGDACGSATALTTDGVSIGAIVDPVADQDWFSFNAVAGQRYEATTLFASASFYYAVDVVGPDCATVLAEWGYWSPDEDSFTATASGTHYLRARPTC